MPSSNRFLSLRCLTSVLRSSIPSSRKSVPAPRACGIRCCSSVTSGCCQQWRPSLLLRAGSGSAGRAHIRVCSITPARPWTILSIMEGRCSSVRVQLFKAVGSIRAHILTILRFYWSMPFTHLSHSLGCVLPCILRRCSHTPPFRLLSYRRSSCACWFHVRWRLIQRH